MMKVLEENKAQTSMEMLLILGGVVVVALVVGLALKNIMGTLGEQAEAEREGTIAGFG